MFTGSAPAKAIVMGEHFVVYGAPAIAVPVKSLSLTVSLTETAEQEPLLGHLGFCFWACRQAFDRGCSVPFSVQVKSSIPKGAGLGSSAALSLAMARAVSQAFQTPVDEAMLREVSMTCERQAHGKPSGIDTEVCLLGRPVWAQPGSPFETLDGGFLTNIGLVILDSGPGGATSEMIQRVSEYRNKNPTRFQTLVEQTRDRSSKTREALLSGDLNLLGGLLNSQHDVLCEVGVSTPELNVAVDCARACGAAGAKLSGAGGGGVAVAIVSADKTQQLADGLRRKGLRVLSAGPIVEPSRRRQ